MTEQNTNPEFPGTPCLLVQACHLPQFFFIAEKLASRYGPVDALFVDHPDARHWLGLFPFFGHVYFFKEELPEEAARYQNLVFPLLNRGYPRIKRAFSSHEGRLWEVDYEGHLQPLSRLRLMGSSLLALHPASPDFVQYLKEFPQKHLGRRILFLESCHPTLIENSREIWEKAVPRGAELTRVSDLSSKSWASHWDNHFDAAIVFFSGETGYLSLKALPFLLRIPEVLVINENGNYFYASLRSFARFLLQRLRHGTQLPEPTPLVLLVQTEETAYVLEAAQRLKKGNVFSDVQVALLCRRQDERKCAKSPDVDQTLTFSRRNLRHNLKTLREVWRLNPDILSAVFVGRRGFGVFKWLFLLFNDRRRLVFNARLDCYWLSPRTLFRMFRRDELLFNKGRPISQLRALFIQTDSWQYTYHAIQALTQPKLFPGACVTLVCRKADRKHFAELPAVTRILTYRKENRGDLGILLKRLRKASPDIVSAVFTGRRGFWKQKLLCLLYLRRKRLIFNAGLDCYWLSLRTIPKLFRQEPLLFEPAPETVSEVLLIQTEADSETARAIDILLSGKVVPNRQVSILCAEEKREFFSRMPSVEKVYTYTPGRLWGSLQTARQLLRKDRDVVAALLTGRPIYRIQKLLFFLLPARHRLVFNENRDCFYLRRGRVTQLLRLPSLAPSLKQATGRISGVRLLLRQIAKSVLFLPRFMYLLVWMTFVKLRRSYHLSE